MAADPEKIVLTIDLAGLVLGDDGTTLADFVAGKAAAQLLDSERRGPYVDALRSRIQAIRDEEIREAVRPLIAAALEKALTPTDGWGNATSPPKTLPELIVEQAEKQLTHPAGKARGGRQSSLLEDVIEKEVGRALRKELEAAVASAKAAVLAAVEAEAANVIRETVARATRGV